MCLKVGAWLWLFCISPVGTCHMYSEQESPNPFLERCINNFWCGDKWKIELNKICCLLDGLLTDYNDETCRSCCSDLSSDERDVCFLIVFSPPFLWENNFECENIQLKLFTLSLYIFLTGRTMSSDTRLNHRGSQRFCFFTFLLW